MSLLYYMFQSILNTFAFGYFFGGKKIIIFTDGGYPPPLAKIINWIFKPIPNRVWLKLDCYQLRYSIIFKLGQMLHGKMLTVQMYTRQLTTHTDGLTIQPSKLAEF